MEFSSSFTKDLGISSAYLFNKIRSLLSLTFVLGGTEKNATRLPHIILNVLLRKAVSYFQGCFWVIKEQRKMSPGRRWLLLSSFSLPRLASLHTLCNSIHGKKNNLDYFLQTRTLLWLHPCLLKGRPQTGEATRLLAYAHTHTQKATFTPCTRVSADRFSPRLQPKCVQLPKYHRAPLELSSSVMGWESVLHDWVQRW